MAGGHTRALQHPHEWEQAKYPRALRYRRQWVPTEVLCFRLETEVTPGLCATRALWKASIGGEAYLRLAELQEKSVEHEAVLAE
jgi:hypothetical protein